ncbi:SH3 domain-containing protein [soil metagenome]
MIRLALLLACITLGPAAQAQSAPQPQWFGSAAALLPPGYIAGQVFHIDATNPHAPVGYLAAYPAAANDPAAAASAFNAGEMLVATLAPVEGGFAAVAAELRPRDAALDSSIQREISAARDERDYLELHAELLKRRNALPTGTMPCDLRAWSTETDRHGLNVRKQPDVKSAVLGTLPPPYKFKRTGDNVPDGGWLTEFTIIGFKNGWFLIEGATPPGKDYEDVGVYPRNHPKPYAGRGWVAASKVGAQYANGDTRMGGLFQAPHVDSKWMPAKGDGGSAISADGGPKKLLACSGFWALLESHDGVRGWWRRLCSSQVTNCS